MAEPKQFEDAESVPIFRPEDNYKRDLGDRLHGMLSRHEATIPELGENIALLADSIDGKNEPDFSWIPEEMTEEVGAAWSEAKLDLEEFAEAEKGFKAAIAEKQAREKAMLQKEESHVAGGRISELKTKILNAPEEKPLTQRQIPTVITKAPTPTMGQRLRRLIGGK